MRNEELGVRNDFYTFALSGRMFCVIDYVPKALPLGYELLGFQPVWIVWG